MTESETSLLLAPSPALYSVSASTTSGVELVDPSGAFVVDPAGNRVSS